MKKIIPVVLICLFAGIYYFYSGSKIYSTKNEKALAAYEEGLNYLTNYYTHEGVAALKQAALEDPEFPLPKLFGLLDSYESKEVRERLKKKLLEELKSPDNNWTEFEKRMVLLVTNSYSNDEKEVAIEIERMFSEYSEQKEVFTLLLPKYIKGIKNQKGILCYYEKLHKMFPNNVQVLNQLGYLYGGMGEDKKAKATFEKYIFIKPNEPNPYDSFGECYLRAGNVDSASEMFKKALVIDPNFTPSRVNLATSLLFKGQITKALEVINYLKSSEYSNILGDYFRLKEVSHLMKFDLKGVVDVIEEAKTTNISQYEIDNLYFYYYAAKQNPIKMKEYITKPVNSKKRKHYFQNMYSSYQKAVLFIVENKLLEAEKILNSIDEEMLSPSTFLRNDFIIRKIRIAMSKAEYDKALTLAEKTAYHENLYWKMIIYNEQGDKKNTKIFAEKVLKVYNSADRDYYIVAEALKYAK